MEMETEDDADGNADPPDPPSSEIPLVQSQEPEFQPEIAEVGPAGN
jgi:hypothetical protein